MKIKLGLGHGKELEMVVMPIVLHMRVICLDGVIQDMKILLQMIIMESFI